MMDLKEEYFTEAMRCKGIEANIIEEIIREFKGCRVYFRGCKINHKDILEDFNQLKKAGYQKVNIIKRLSLSYEKSQCQIRRIIKTA